MNRSEIVEPIICPACDHQIGGLTGRTVAQQLDQMQDAMERAGMSDMDEKTASRLLDALLVDARSCPVLWEWPGFMPLACHLSDIVDDAAWNAAEAAESGRS